jgi:hypothetical protein
MPRAIDKPLGMTEIEVLDGIKEHIHWPLELSLTPAALHRIEIEVRDALDMLDDGPVTTELANLCSTIRAHLQHVVKEEKESRAKAALSDPLLG